MNNRYKFDDERVSICEEKDAMNDNYGGEHEVTYTLNGMKRTTTQKKHSNAYMLVYIRY
jgi:hypothetical protein